MGKKVTPISQDAARGLLEALKLALECISYCRRAHQDSQSGEGVPVEALLMSAIFKAENGREPTATEFCNFAIKATAKEIEPPNA